MNFADLLHGDYKEYARRQKNSTAECFAPRCMCRQIQGCGLSEAESTFIC